MATYQDAQRKKVFEDSKAKIAGGVAELAANIIVRKSNFTSDPEFKKLAAKLTGKLSKEKAEHLWQTHGKELEKHVLKAFGHTIDPDDGGLYKNHEVHVENAAADAADDIWDYYHDS